MGFSPSPLQITLNAQQRAMCGQRLVLQIPSSASPISRPPRRPLLFAIKSGDYFDTLATWLNILSNQNYNTVSLIRRGE